MHRTKQCNQTKLNGRLEHSTPNETATTHKLLAEIAQQLQAQTAELRAIRRSAASCDKKLSLVTHLLHYLADCCSVIATAVANYVSSATAEQHARRLQAALSSGRLTMLALIACLSVYTSSHALSAKCAARSSKRATWQTLWLRASGLQQPLQALLAPFVQQLPRRPQQISVQALLQSWSGWENMIRTPRCIISFAGWFALGWALLVLWGSYAWSQRAAAVASSTHQTTAGAAAASMPGDPLLCLLLTALPVKPSKVGIAAMVVQAALYEGLLGAVVVALLYGRWAAWLMVWEAWVYCCYRNCCTGLQHEQLAKRGLELIEGQLFMQNSSSPQHLQLQQHRGQQLQQQRLPHVTEQGQHLMMTAAAGASQHASQPATGSTIQNDGTVQQHKRPGSRLSMQLLLAVAQLLLPVVMAAVAVYR